MPHENIKLKSLTIAAAGLIGLLLADTVWAHHPAGTGGKLVFRLSSDIGSFKPNSNGLYNMSGNVAEWVNDYYDVRPSRSGAVLDPTGPSTGTRHVIRGASWALGSRTELRLSYREAGVDGRLDVGFRIARYVDSAGAKP